MLLLEFQSRTRSMTSIALQTSQLYNSFLHPVFRQLWRGKYWSQYKTYSALSKATYCSFDSSVITRHSGSSPVMHHVSLRQFPHAQKTSSAYERRLRDSLAMLNSAPRNGCRKLSRNYPTKAAFQVNNLFKTYPTCQSSTKAGNDYTIVQSAVPLRFGGLSS